MAFNGLGTFLRAYNWQTDAANGIKVDASRMDGEFDNFATGLSTCITKDGQTTVTANIPMNSKKFTGLADGSASGDSCTYGQLSANIAGITELSAGDTTLTATAFNQILVQNTTTTVGTLTLPLLSTTTNTKSITFVNLHATDSHVVQRQGSDTITSITGTGQTSITVKPGETLILMSSGSTGVWFAIDGSAILDDEAGAGPFGSLRNTTNFYQKFPGGLIMQITRKIAPAGGSDSFSWPIAFPNDCLAAQATYSGFGSGVGLANIDVLNTATAATNLTTTGGIVYNRYAGADQIVSVVGWGY